MPSEKLISTNSKAGAEELQLSSDLSRKVELRTGQLHTASSRQYVYKSKHYIELRCPHS
jgi:hypothetical protein